MKKFWNFVIVIMVSLLSVVACKNSEPPQDEPQKVRDEITETDVYSSLINQQLAIPLSYINMGETVYIVNRTYNSTCYMCYEHISDDELYNLSPSLDRETVKDFRTVNKESYSLNLPLSVTKSYQYIDEPPSNEWGAIGHNQGFLLVTMFSKIGFNKGLDQALVYMAHICGNECGVGIIYFLVKNGNNWQIKGTTDVWYS